MLLSSSALRGVSFLPPQSSQGMLSEEYPGSTRSTVRISLRMAGGKRNKLHPMGWRSAAKKTQLNGCECILR